MEPSARVELATPSLPRTCSTPELRGLAASRLRCFAVSRFRGEQHRETAQLRDLVWSGRRGSNPRPTAWKAVTLPTELLPRSFPAKKWWREEGSNLRRSLDRQIYSLLLLTTQPSLRDSTAAGAGDGTRTRDLLITNQLLYQLSYASDKPLDFKDTNSHSTLSKG